MTAHVGRVGRGLFLCIIITSVHCFAPSSGGMCLKSCLRGSGSRRQLARKDSPFSNRLGHATYHRFSSYHVTATKLVCAAKWYGDTPYEDAPDAKSLVFESNYLDKTGQERGFCNWIVPNKVLVGRYPHGTPMGTKTGRPSPHESREHLRKITAAGVSIFVMLQSEVPAQEDDAAWPRGDLVPLADAEKAAKYPEGFSRYYQDAIAVAEELGCSKAPQFEHFPIPDFGVSDMGDMTGLLYDLRDRIRIDGDIVYIHCWGGRGRAGTVGACLYLMLRYKDGASFDPQLAAQEALDVVQRGYDTRAGEDGGGSKSPETEEQREFVRRFAHELYAQYGLNQAF